MPAYSLTEIWAEKTRSLMQRAEPRDVYDLDALAERFRDLPLEARPVFGEKARARGLDPGNLGLRLDARESTLRRLWADRLRDQVAEVPPFESTWRAVRRSLRQAGYLE